MIFALLFLLFSYTEAIRVCSDFKSYYKPLSKKCFDNPITEMNTTEIIQSWGFKAEEHVIHTNDGYYILINRLIPNKQKHKNPIIMGHGIYMNSLGFVTLGNTSLPLILAEKGFEVWFINFRGTKYSRKHEILTEEELNYWKFTLEDMAKNDLYQILELVYKLSGEKSIFIGFSMSTTISYIYSSLNPQHAKDHLLSMIHLAPVAFLNNIESAARYLKALWPLVKPIVETEWHGEIVMNFENCARLPLLMYRCEFLKSILFGSDYSQINPLTFPITNTMNGDSIAIGVLDHYSQIIKSGQFSRYDYGPEENLKRYKSKIPPSYDLSKVPVPVSLFIGPNDILGTVDNAKVIYNQLDSKVRCGFNIIDYDSWAHMDFISAKDRTIYLYPNVLKIVDNMIKGAC